jgi:hypothetical protein
MQLGSNSAKISQFLSELLGEKITFEVALKQIVKTPPIEQTAPACVKILCDVFKGQITGHSKRSEQEIASEKSKESEGQPQESHESSSEEDSSDSD